MRQKAEVPSVRRNLAIPEAFLEQAVDLRIETESDSLSEVIRRALTSYSAFITATQRHAQLYIRRNDGSKMPVTEDGLLEQGQNLVKVNLIFHEGSEARLDELRSLTSATSDSDVVRRAVKLYQLLVREYASGNSIELREADGRVVEIELWNVPRRPWGGRPGPIVVDKSVYEPAQ